MRTWGVIGVALALGAGGLAAACGSEASVAPAAGEADAGVGAAVVEDAGPQAFAFSDAEPPLSQNEENDLVFAQRACALLRTCAVVEAGVPPLEDGLAPLVEGTSPVASRGLVSLETDGGRAELVRAKAGGGDALEARDVPGAARIRRAAGAAHRLVCDATGACEVFWGAYESSLRKVPAVYGAVDLAVDYVGGDTVPWRRRTWVAGSQGLWVGFEGEELRPVPGLDVPPTAIARVGRSLVVVGRAGFAARLVVTTGAVETFVVERIAVEGAPDFVDLDVRRGAWIASAADGRLVFGVRSSAQSCDLGEPLAGVSAGDIGHALRIATRGGKLFELRGYGEPSCGGLLLGRPVDHLGTYGCGHYDNPFVVAPPSRDGTSTVLGWEPFCPIR